MSRTISCILAVVCILTTCRGFPVDRLSKKCGKGTMLAPDGSCQTCPPNFFNDREDHTYPSCLPCTKRESMPNVMETQGCNSEHDTTITRCEKGHYIKKTYEHREECSECPPDGCRLEPDCCTFNDITTNVEPGTTVASPTIVSMSLPWLDSSPGLDWNQTHPNASNISEVVNVYQYPGEDKKISPVIVAVVSTVPSMIIILTLAVIMYCCLKKPYLRYIRAKTASDEKREQKKM